MFEFIEKTANDIVGNIKSEKTLMISEAKSYEAKVRENENQAEIKETQAKTEEASCPHFKENEINRINENGEMETVVVMIPDLEADAAAMANAASLRAEAATLRAEAVILNALVLALNVTIEAIQRQFINFSNTIIETKKAIENTKNILDEGINIISNAISVFDVAEAKDLKEWFSGVEENIVEFVEENWEINLKKVLEDGRKWVYETGQKTKAQIVENVKSGIEDLLELDVKTFLTNTPILRNGTIFALGLMGVYTPPNIDEAYIVDNEKVKETKEEAIRLYFEYLDTLNISEEKKKIYKENFTREIQNIIVLKDDYFEKIYTTSGNKETMAVYKGAPGKGQGFFKESGFNVHIVMHEIGGHSTGTMLTSKLSKKGMYIYDITNPDNIPRFFGMGIETGMNETTTEYFTRKICKEINPECAYNYSVDLLKKFTDSMIRYGICDAEAILYESYVGENKNLFKEQYNEIVGDIAELNYDAIEQVMYDANTARYYNKYEMDKIADEFDKKCAEYAKNHKK